jgi:uncharacterized protein
VTQENVDVIRRSFEAFTRGDLEAALAMLDPAVEWKQMEEPEAAHGPAAVIEALGRWTEMWTGAEVTPQEWIDAGDSVVVRVKWTGRSRATGIPVEQFAYNVFTLHGGKVVRMREYGAHSRAEALEAVGLSESET